jgi:hypothetical protein
MLLEFFQMAGNIVVIFQKNFQMKALINQVLNGGADIITELL